MPWRCMGEWRCRSTIANLGTRGEKLCIQDYILVATLELGKHAVLSLQTAFLPEHLNYKYEFPEVEYLFILE
jgi:hypothetical protein